MIDIKFLALNHTDLEGADAQPMQMYATSMYAAHLVQSS